MPSSTYPTRALGKNGPLVSAIGFGAMGLGAAYGPANEADSFKTLTYAADRGVTFWDTSDLYGPSEAILGKWFKETGRREEIFLATKFGARDQEKMNLIPNSKPSYIKRRLENSLKDLQTDHIDLYYQHRPDPEVPIEIVLEALKPYIEKGTIKYIGLSEVTIADVKRAKAVGGLIAEKLVAVQMEFSPFELHIEQTGYAKAAEELGIAIVAYSPLARGLVTGRYRSPDDFEEGDSRKRHPRFTAENFPKNLAVADKIKAIGDKYNASAAQVTLAWILASHSNFVPIPGSRNAERLEDNAKGAELKLSDEDIKALREVVEAAEIAGSRYPEWAIAALQKDSLPLDQWKGEP